MNKKVKLKYNQNGAMLIVALIFTLLFTVVAVALSSMVASQHKLGLKKINWAKALAAAEAGINYYRWHLAHAPSDYQDGTEQPGPYVHEYKDSLGNTVGYFSLNITPPSQCSNTVIIESTGWANSDPLVTRTVKVKYGKPSLAQFAFLTNSNVWFGDKETLHGPLHSNGGIRMDGYNDAKTTSAKETYICGPEHGCWYETKPGIWGEGGEQNLWDFPVSNVDFNAVTADLATLKTLAQGMMCSATEDCYFEENGLGYHLVFKSDGTFDLYKVTQLKNPIWGYDGSRWVRESDDINKQSYIGNYNIPNECGIIFIGDDLWIDGTVNGKVTVVAAKLPETGNSPKIIINGNLIYQSKDGSDILGLISQSDILVPFYSAPNDLEIDAALMAQKGHVYRKFYCVGWGCPRWAPWWYAGYIIRNSITVYGVIITNTIWTWTWTDAFGHVVSGYRNTDTIYDSNLTYNPPPGFPTTGDYEILQWEETSEKQ